MLMVAVSLGGMTGVEHPRDAWQEQAATAAGNVMLISDFTAALDLLESAAGSGGLMLHSLCREDS